MNTSNNYKTNYGIAVDPNKEYPVSYIRLQDGEKIYSLGHLLGKDMTENQIKEWLHFINSPAAQWVKASAEEVLNSIDAFLINKADELGMEVDFNFQRKEGDLYTPLDRIRFIQYLIVQEGGRLSNEEIDRICDVADNDFAMVEAIKFAEWTQKNYWELNDDGLWYKWMLRHDDDTELTTTKLYALFKNYE